MNSSYGGLGDQRRGEQRRLVGARGDGRVAEQDRVARRALRRDREVGVDRRDRPSSRWPCRSSRRSGRRPGRRSRRPPCWPGSARPGPLLLRIVRARPENVTSTVVSVARAAASHSWRKRSRIALVVGLVGAADHEPRRGPVRDDVGGRPALPDDPVDARGRVELLAPQPDRGEQQDHRVERVLAAPRVRRRVRLQPVKTTSTSSEASG